LLLKKAGFRGYASERGIGVPPGFFFLIAATGGERSGVGDIPNPTRRLLNSMPCNVSQHHNQHEMQKHSNTKTPGEYNNPCAVANGSAGRDIRLWGALSGKQSNSNTQGKRCTNRGKTHLNQQRLVTAFTQSPLLTRNWYSFWLYERDGIKPGAPLTN